MRRTFALAVALACLPASAMATTFVVFRLPDRIVMASDVFAVGLDANGRTQDTTVPCKIRRAGQFWFLNGGAWFPDIIASRIEGQPTVLKAVQALEASDLQNRVVAIKAVFAERHSPGSPLLTVVVADRTMSLGVFQVSLKTASPFTVQAESGLCPGSLCPGGSYFLVGRAAGAPDRPLPAWFPGAGDVTTARRFIEGEIQDFPQLVRPPIDTLEITPSGPRWIDRAKDSTCAAQEGW